MASAKLIEDTRVVLKALKWCAKHSCGHGLTLGDVPIVKMALNPKGGNYNYAMLKEALYWCAFIPYGEGLSLGDVPIVKKALKHTLSSKGTFETAYKRLAPPQCQDGDN